jgi:hypothetical protein
MAFLYGRAGRLTAKNGGFRPGQLPQSTKLRFLEAFWESESPRLGETGAAGWNSWMKQAEEQLNNVPANSIPTQPEGAYTEGRTHSAFTDFVKENSGGAVEAHLETDIGVWDASDDDDNDEANAVKTPEVEQKAAAAAQEMAEIAAEDKSLIMQWFKEEEDMSKTRWRPLGATGAAGDEAEKDPERVVLFEDVASLICCYTDAATKAELAAAFLTFVGAELPAIFEAGAAQLQQVSDDTGLFELVDCLDALLVQTARNPDTRNSVFAVLRMQTSAAIPCSADPGWTGFVRNSFASLCETVSIQPAAHICSGLLHFEFDHGQPNSTEDAMIKHGRQSAMHILGQQRWCSDMDAWRAYAMAEEKLGNLREAQKIYDTALVMAPSSGAGSRWGQGPHERWRSSLQIRRTYAELEIQCDNSKRALHVLTSGFGDDPNGYKSIKVRSKGKQRSVPTPTPTQILTARHAYRNLAESGDRSSSATVHGVICHALLQYLAAGFDSLCAVYDDASKSLFAEAFRPVDSHLYCFSRLFFYSSK